MKKTSILTAIFISLIIFISDSCSSNNNKKNDEPTEGETLARTYCISCHTFPEPDLLDKKTWSEGVLPKMAELLQVAGYYNPNNSVNTSDDPTSSGAQPAQSFPIEKWEKIVKYYTDASPDKLPNRIDSLSPIEVGLTHFSSFSLYGRFANPVTTLVYFDTTVKKLFFSDGGAGKVFGMDASLNVTDSFTTSAGATDIHPGQLTSVVSIGSIQPSDAPTGKLEYVKPGEDPVTIIGSLRRPVQATYADLNNDGKEDVIISEFGFRRGALSWFENAGKGAYTKHVLKNLPGAIRTEVHDFNKDGKLDIIALMSQGDEGVFIYYNEGNGKFKEERAIQFPPSYGSNYFQLFDFNRDGFMDIITTNGDNADYSIIFKPYHGIRIFYNDGKNKFEQKYFLPVHGAQKAIPADFDNDGDIDLVSIAFYPDYENLPEESFIYWENSGNNTYKRSTFVGFAEGRWITMDAGDIDGDGDKDIVLGNAFFPVGSVPTAYINQWRNKLVSIMILENTVIKK